MPSKHPIRIGLLTGGGDCPGLNAAIRSVVRRAFHANIDVYAIFEGFKGLVTDHVEPFRLSKSSGILHVGGTILKSSRHNPFLNPAHKQALVNHYYRHNLNGLIVIGGDGTLRLANQINKELKIPCIGIPKTIDNDVFGTDVTIGFDTAVETATEAIDKLHTTAESHNVVMVVEVMGRHTGWIATASGLAGGADLILIPEKPMKLDTITETITKRHARGKNFSIVVVAEDAKVTDAKGRIIFETPTIKDGYGPIKSSGAGEGVAKIIQSATGFESRVVVLGHVQRGGSPSPRDRILATQMGSLAVDLVIKKQWNRMTVLQKGEITSIPLKNVCKKIKRVDDKLYKLASAFFN